MRRYILGSALVLTVALWTGSAQALTLVTCSGTDQVHFSPGLTYQQQTVALSGQDSGTCFSLTNPSCCPVTRSQPAGSRPRRRSTGTVERR